MKKILVATDLSARSDRAILRAIKLAEEFKASLKIIHVIDCDLPKEFLEESKKIAKKEISYFIKNKTRNIKITVEIAEGVAHIDILRVANNENFDLIILGLHRHVDSAEPIVGKVIDRIVKNSHKPVLVVRDHAGEEYKNILVGVDFNIHSQRSLEFTLKTFKDATINLVHSYHMPFLGTGNYEELEAQLKKTCQDDLDKMIEGALADIPSKKTLNKIKKRIVKGSIFDVLDMEIAKIKPEVLVLGTHARSGLAKLLSLNVTESFLVDPSCDLLVIS